MRRAEVGLVRVLEEVPFPVYEMLLEAEQSGKPRRLWFCEKCMIEKIQ
jgi:hypothetical protein